MRINNCISYNPVFGVQFAKDIQTKNVLKTELARSEICWPYLVHKYMPEMGAGIVSIKPIENDMLELTNSLTGNSVQYPNDGGFFFNLVDMISFNAFDTSYLHEYQLDYAPYDHDCKKFFGVHSLMTEPDVLLLDVALKEIKEKSGTSELHKQMEEIIDMERNNPKEYKKNKKALENQFNILYDKVEKQEREYVASLFEEQSVENTCNESLKPD